MKHAFLIIAHGKWEQLSILLKQLDAENHDIFIHIDDKAKSVPIQMLKDSVKLSNIEIYKNYKVYWGSFELVKTEIFLLKKSFQKKYDYYHLLSGMDLLIKSNNYIDKFFEKNKGYEFVHFDTEKRLKEDKEIMRRTRCYHFFTNYRRRYKNNVLNNLFTFLERCSLAFQIVIGIDRTKKYKDFQIKYGSQWFSITNDLTDYILKNEKKIYYIFHHTKCADELFVQSLVYNSKFRDKLYDKNFEDNMSANMRLIDMKNRGWNGSPYTWKNSDFNEIKNSECIFARKFDIDENSSIIDKVIKITAS